VLAERRAGRAREQSPPALPDPAVPA
jgi:hypothetical protein